MRPIVLCAAVLGGLALGDVARLDVAHLVLGLVLAAAGAALAWRHAGWRMAALVACAVAAGGLRATLARPPDALAVLEPYYGQTVRVRGEVVQPPTVSASSVQLEVQVDAVGPAGHDPGPVGRDPGPVGRDPGPVGRDPGPVGRDPGPVGRDPGVAGHDQGPGSHDPGPIGHDPEPAGASAAAAPTASGGDAPTVRVVGDPAVLGALQAHAPLVLEGRLLADDGEPLPTLLFPSLLAAYPPPPPGQPAALLATVRAAAERGIRRYLPAPQASLAAGVLLGGSSGLDADLKLDLQRAGLSHLVAIDGFKQAVVAGTLGAAAVRLVGRRLAVLPTCLGIAAYTLLTGAHPSALRAALMLGLAMLASLTGRVADPLTSVLVAVVVMGSIEPRILLDTGLQLSLSAVLGIVLLWPRWRARLSGLPRWLAEPAGLTLAVTLATLPVTLAVFAMVSLVSPLAHVLVVPLLAPVLVSAALLALAAPVPPLGALAAWVAWVPSTLLVELIRICGGLPGAALSTGRLPPVGAGCLAAALLTWGVLGLPEAAPARAAWAHWRMRPAGAWTPFACVAVCLVAGGLLQSLRPDQRLHVQTLAAGRGQAVLIRGPTGRTTLVAGGHLDGTLLAGQVADHLAIWEHTLDSVLLLDPAAEAGLRPTLERYPPRQRVVADSATRLDLGGGAALDVYVSEATPPDAVSGQANTGSSKRQANTASSGSQSNDGGVSLSFGRVWLALVGHPPAPAQDSTEQLVVPYAPPADLASDGASAWPDT